jgi:hypothetical protein
MRRAAGGGVAVAVRVEAAGSLCTAGEQLREVPRAITDRTRMLAERVSFHPSPSAGRTPGPRHAHDARVPVAARRIHVCTRAPAAETGAHHRMLTVWAFPSDACHQGAPDRPRTRPRRPSLRQEQHAPAARHRSDLTSGLPHPAPPIGSVVSTADPCTGQAFKNREDPDLSGWLHGWEGAGVRQVRLRAVADRPRRLSERGTMRP